MRILIAPMTAGGDFHPVVAAALGLVERGHEVLVYTEASGIRMLRDVDVPQRTSPRELEFARRLIAQHAPELQKGSAEGAEALERVLDEYSADQAAEIREHVLPEFLPDLFVTSLVGGGIARLLGAECGLPTCVINSDFYIGPDPPCALEDDYDERCIPEIEYLAKAIQSADLVLHAVDHAFDYDFDGLPETNHYVGPLIWEQPQPAPSYLDAPGNPWALVSISSQKQNDVTIARFALEAFERLPLRMVETIGPGHRRKELGEIPDDVHVEHHIPHSAVLERAKVCVSHCGIGSINKTMWYGVPLVMVPWGRDQKGVARRAARLGVGVVVPRDELSEPRLERALHEVLDDPSYAEAARATSERFRAQDPVGRTCDLVESRFSAARA